MNFRSFSLLSLTGLLASLAVSANDAVSAPNPAPLPPEVQALVDAAASRSEKSPEVVADDPLGAAWQMARIITGDHDIACQLQLRCVQAYLAVGKVDEAARLALEIPDYRSALGSLECAEAFLLAGHSDKGQSQIKRVENVLGVVKPWQQDVIRIRMAAVSALAGADEGQITRWTSSIESKSDRFAAQVLAAVWRMTRLKKYDLKIIQELLEKKPPQKAPIPELVQAARWLMRHSESFSENAKNVDGNLIAGVDELLRHSHAYPTPALLDLTEYYVARGEKSMARKVLARAEPQIGFHLEAGGELYARMANFWELRGSVSEVLPFFEAVERRAKTLLPMERPAALAWLSECWRTLGQTKRAEEALNAALMEARSNLNPRMRLLGGVEICLCHALGDRTLPESLVKPLNAILLGEPPVSESIKESK